MLELTNKELNYIKKIDPQVIVLLDIQEEEREELAYRGATHKIKRKYYNLKYVCNCKESNGVVQEEKNCNYWNSVKCNHCGGTVWHNSLIKVPGLKNNNSFCSKTQSKINKSILVEKHPDDETGIRIICVERNSSTKEDPNLPAGCIGCVEYVVKNYVDFIPGKTIKGYRALKRSNKEIPVIDALNLNSLNVSNMYDNCRFYYEDSSSFWEFLEKNETFAERSGFSNILKNSKLTVSQDSLLLLYTSLIEQYPVLELIIKMGCYKLFDDMLLDVAKCTSRIEIKSRVAGLNKLLNAEETSGSKALRLPKYMNDILRANNAGLGEYIVWSNIIDITKMSKEQVEKFFNSKEYWYVKHSLYKFPNILKYGYTVPQLAKYIKKQINMQCSSDVYRGYNDTIWQSANRSLMLMSDYLSMCELNEIEPDKFPKDIKKAHDDMTKVIQMKQDDKTDKILRDIANYYSSELDKEPKAPEEETKMGKQFKIIFPSSINDFVNEGNRMSSCIGHYANKVARGERVVFFIRNVEELDESFISAEYVDGKLGQCEYECTIPVKDREILDYCRVICNKIHRAKLKRDLAS